MNGSLAFTWSPAPATYAPYVDPEKQYDACFSIVKKLSKCSKFVAYAELNQNGNIHFHAIVQLHDKVKWYKSVLPTFKRTGFVVMKFNVDEQWHKYISKEFDLMVKLIGYKARIYNDNVYLAQHVLVLDPEHVFEIQNKSIELGGPYALE